MLAIHFSKYIPNLRLGQPFAIQAAGQLLTFYLLVSEKCKNGRVEITIPVPWDPELQHSPIAITLALAEAIAFVTCDLLPFLCASQK